MTVFQNQLFENLLVIAIIASLIALIYCRVTHKTIADVFREIREIFEDREEEVLP